NNLIGLGANYSWEPSSNVDYGPFAVIQGFEGATPNPSNPLVPYMRMDVQAVPVPAAIWLFGSGLIGLVGFARRKNR
ncbi:MAG: VPLPA-CTERM sorting domain-containing protein, partial [Gammaproteobacteria bacterium]|nr:VPLPA-CTERM sorting domain-containing protein [Gammaproteobacteria bacterium]